MSKDILIVVDFQNDFIDGALGTPEAREIVEAVKNKISSFKGEVFATRDTHYSNYLQTSEGKKLPVEHCIEGSEGWELHPAINQLIKNDHKLNKNQFGDYNIPQKIQAILNAPLSSITLIGICTGICVISNALILKAFYPEIPITVDSSCCACVNPQSHQVALQAMKMCQIDVI